MKIAAYEVRPDEKPVIENLCKKYGIDLISTPANLDKTTAQHGRRLRRRDHAGAERLLQRGAGRAEGLRRARCWPAAAWATTT